MLSKWRTLGGVATAAVVGALALSATPSFAQTSSGSTTQSAPMTTTPSDTDGTLGTQDSSGMNAGSPDGATQSSASGQTAVDVSKPKSTLASARVEDSSGATIGTVSHVTTNSSGKARMIDVSLTSSGKKIKIDASKLRYEPSSHVLKADMTKQELDQMNGTASQTQTP